MEITLGNIVFGGSSTGAGGTGGGNWTEDKEFATAEAFCNVQDYIFDLDDRVSTLESSSGSSLDFTDVWYIYAPANCQMKVVNQDETTQDVTTSNGIIKYSDFPDGMYAYSQDTTTPLEKIICMGKTCFIVHNFDSIYCDTLVTSTPDYVIEGLETLSGTWAGCTCLTSVPHFNTEHVTNFVGTWAGCTSLLTIPPLNFKSATNISGCFSDCTSLTTLPYMNLASVTDFTEAWLNCENLTTLGGFGAISADIDLSYSPNLTVESIMNVINQAATVTAQRMTFGSENLAKLTDEQKSVATSKGWRLA